MPNYPINKEMKILFLNPGINAGHPISLDLKSRGVSLLFSTDAEEAWQLLQLHGQGIDLAVVHREGGQPGSESATLGLISRVKSSTAQADLPIILTTSEWNSEQCAQHQQSKEGVNAYLCEPLTEQNLLSTVEAVLGQTIPKQSDANQPALEISLISEISLAPEISLSPEVSLPSPEISMSLAPESESMNQPIEAEDKNLEPEKGGFEFSLISISDTFDSAESEKILTEFNLEAPVAPNIPPPFEGSTQTQAALPMESVEQKLETPSGPSPSLELSLSAATSEPSGSVDLNPSPPIPFSPSDGGLSLEISLSEAPPLSVGDDLIAPSSAASPSLEIGLSVASVEQPQEIGGVVELNLTPPELSSESVSLNSVSFENPPVPPQETRLTDMSGPSSNSLPENPLTDPQAEEEMPYLYQRKVQSLIYEPLGDAVIPGGAAQSPDIETLKKYLVLREQDVAVLSSQLKEARDQIAASEKQIREERAKGVELLHTCQEQKKKLEEDDSRRAALAEMFEGDTQELRFQLRAKADQVKVLDAQVQQFSEEITQLKERVRIDIRKIRVRERELENRLEMTRRDSEALLNSREAKLIELKRNLDLMEFNMDLLQNQYAKEKEISAKLREKVAKLAQVVRIADGLLETPSGVGSSDGLSEVESLEKKEVS